MKFSKLVFAISLFLLVVCVSCKTDKDKYKDLPKPLATLNLKIDNDPKNSDLYYQRAQYYYANGFIEEGFKDAAMAVKLDAKKSPYHVILSDFYFAKKETDLAEESLQKAIQLDPKNNDARLKLAELYYHLGMIAECNTTLDETLKLKPFNPTAHLIRAFCLKEVNDTIGMLRMLQLVIDQNPKEKKAYLELGYYYQERLNPIAIQYYQNGLRLDPKDKELNYNLAKLYQDLGELDAAIQQYNTILSFDPKNVLAFNNIGYINLVEFDNYDEAIAYFTKAIDIDPAFINALCNRGVAFELSKNYGNARKDFNACKTLDPHFEPAIKGLNRLDKIKQ
jgi:tetratricopeptide (TPR) repeat protein